MIIKLKAGQEVKVNGESWRIKSTNMENYNGYSQVCSIDLQNDLQDMTIEFSSWAIGINENDLVGLATLLTTG